jgi:hypothetical protein
VAGPTFAGRPARARRARARPTRRNGSARAASAALQSTHLNHWRLGRREVRAAEIAITGRVTSSGMRAVVPRMVAQPLATAETKAATAARSRSPPYGLCGCRTGSRRTGSWWKPLTKNRYNRAHFPSGAHFVATCPARGPFFPVRGYVSNVAASPRSRASFSRAHRRSRGPGAKTRLCRRGAKSTGNSLVKRG